MAKLGLSAEGESEASIVLEKDGTLVDEDEVLELLNSETFLLLLPNESWTRDTPDSSKLPTEASSASYQNHPVASPEVIPTTSTGPPPNRDSPSLSNSSQNNLVGKSYGVNDRVVKWAIFQIMKSLMWARCLILFNVIPVSDAASFILTGTNFDSSIWIMWGVGVGVGWGWGGGGGVGGGGGGWGVIWIITCPNFQFWQVCSFDSLCLFCL